MERIAKMDYEIDPNSPFNKLKKLQVSLKQETSLLDIFYDDSDNLYNEVEDKIKDRTFNIYQDEDDFNLEDLIHLKSKIYIK